MQKPSPDLIEAFFEWYRAHTHSKSEDEYAGIITRDHLSSLSDAEFVEFFYQFACDGGRIQSGGRRTALRFKKAIEEKLPEFRAFVLEPFGANFDELQWLERASAFFGFGKGLSTIYLNRVDKTRFAIVNEKAIDAYELFGVHVPSGRSEAYAAIRDAERQLIAWYPAFANHFRADALAEFLIGQEDGQPWRERLGGNQVKEGAVSSRYSLSAPTRLVEHPFTDKTFALLQRLHENATQEFYSEHADEFREKLESPFQQVLRSVSELLPTRVLAMLETEAGVFSRIVKNDYGRGGAWDFYWGAFYPKGGKRIADPQLYLSINHEFLAFGFYIGDYAKEPRARFLTNCEKHIDLLKGELETSLSDPRLLFGSTGEGRSYRLPAADEKRVSWDEWLENSETHGIRAAVVLPATEVVRMTGAQLVESIATTFQELFPLVLLAASDDPKLAISDYLEGDSEALPGQNPTYSLDACAADTYLDLTDLTRWLRAIERKKQGIFYGPPGTGKTFIAQKLGRHLIGGGDGFCETVQFHPSYAYEDFMQGLRPKIAGGGRLEYVMVPGRFKDFCARTRTRTGTCVLIIDEINRANLSRVLGELMYLLEYRNEEVPLAGGETFRIPDNVRIIGTMNTADRSIALVDHALRRRFAFISLYPNYEVLQRYHKANEFDPSGLIEVLQRVNSAIDDRHYSIGISFFLRPDLAEHLEGIWQMEIEPYLEELFFDQPQKAEKFSWPNVRGEILHA